jgi:hypothetical protein
MKTEPVSIGSCKWTIRREKEKRALVIFRGRARNDLGFQGITARRRHGILLGNPHILQNVASSVSFFFFS